MSGLEAMFKAITDVMLEEALKILSVVIYNGICNRLSGLVVIKTIKQVSAPQ